jgi:hypothetical protein
MKIKEIDGLPVIDAKRPITITITKSDVDKADVKEPAGCAVARACRRDLHAIEARVHLARVYVRTNKGNWTRYMTPRSMRSEIVAFDRGGQFEPGEFTLSAPSATKVLGKRRGGSKPFVKRGKKRKPPHVITNVRHGPA